MSRKVTLTLKATAIINVEEGVDMEEVVSGLELSTGSLDVDLFVEDFVVNHWEVEDSR